LKGYTKFALDGLLEKIEKEFFEEFVYTKVNEDQPFQRVLKEYSQTVSGLISRLLKEKNTYLANSLECLWKFLVLVVDRVCSVKERWITRILSAKMGKMEESYNFEVKSFAAKQKNYEEQILKGAEKAIELKAKIESLEAENFQVKQDLMRANERMDVGNNLDTESMFNIMDVNLHRLSLNIRQSEVENHKQKILLTENISSILTMATKKNKTNNTIETQTDLNMSAFNTVIRKYNITEFNVPLNSLLNYQRNPLIKLIMKDIREMKYRRICVPMTLQESLNYIENICEKVLAICPVPQ
jgi:hypothetical protein